MARLKQGIHGPISGKLGTAVGVTWKGIPYLRSLPYPRSKKRTAKEAANQQKFAKMHNWLHPMLDFLRAGFKGYSATIEGFNAAKSYNLNNAFVTDSDKVQYIDPARIRVSHGDLPLPENIECRAERNNIVFTWQVPQGGYQGSSDQAMLLAYNPDNLQCAFITDGDFRKTGKAILPFLQGDYFVYIAFVSADRMRRSNSLYLGKVRV